MQISLARRPRLRAPYEMSLGERLFLARLRARDERAFQELVTESGDRVFNLVLRMVGDRAEAEDIAQEVYVTVWKSIDTYRGEAKLSTWLLRIAANHAKNRIKYLARRATDKGGLDEAPEAAMADLGKAPAQAHVSSPEAALEAAERGTRSGAGHRQPGRGPPAGAGPAGHRGAGLRGDSARSPGCPRAPSSRASTGRGWP